MGAGCCVTAFTGGVEGCDEQALGAAVFSGVEAHPAGDGAEVGDGGEEGAAGRFGVGAGVEQADGVLDLGDDGLAGEDAAVAVVQVAEGFGDLA